MTPLPPQGTVVLAEIADSNGFRKVRPAVVVTSGDPLRVVPVTTRVPDPLPADHVLLPFHPGGRARTGLRARSAAVCSWVRLVPVREVKSIIGFVPDPVLATILPRVPPMGTP